MNMSQNKHTKQQCHAKALKYHKRQHFKHDSPAEYYYAYRKGWLGEICSHMKRVPWTFEMAYKIAKQYKYKYHFHKQHTALSKYSIDHGWYPEITKHMEDGRKLRRIWSKDKCIALAKKYKYSSDWKRNDYTSYNSAQRYGWLPECIKHMKPKSRKKPRLWTKEKCIAVAHKYNSIWEWNKKGRGSYMAARRYGWIKDCTRHMKKNKHK